MISTHGEGVQDLLEEHFDLFKKSFGIQLAFEDHIAGIATERGVIAEIKTFGAGFLYKSFEHIPRLHHIPLPLSHAQALLLEILYLGDDPWGNTFDLQKADELVLLLKRFGSIQIFFHPLKNQEARDLRPFHL